MFSGKGVQYVVLRDKGDPRASCGFGEPHWPLTEGNSALWPERSRPRPCTCILLGFAVRVTALPLENDLLRGSSRALTSRWPGAASSGGRRDPPSPRLHFPKWPAEGAPTDRDTTPGPSEDEKDGHSRQGRHGRCETWGSASGTGAVPKSPGPPLPPSFPHRVTHPTHGSSHQPPP